MNGRVDRFTDVVSRSSGGLDLLGSDPSLIGWDIRLKGDGTPARFGRHGKARFPFVPEHVAPGIDGAVFILGFPAGAIYASEEEEPRAYRLLADGKLDPDFGGRRGLAVRLPGSRWSVAALQGGKALVMDRGLFFCRGNCPPQPGFARFLEGSARG